MHGFGNGKKIRPGSWTPLRIWLSRNWLLWTFLIIIALYAVFWTLPDGQSIANGQHESQGLSRVRGGEARLSDVIAASLYLSELAAHEIMDVKRGGREDSRVKGKTDEGVDEPVTVADARSNSVFVNGLRTLFPGVDILSEEIDPEPAQLSLSLLNTVSLDEDPMLNVKDLLITVDPLDATKEFTEDLLQYVTTMVCVAHKGRPIAGIINEPFLKGGSAIWGVALESGYKALHGLQHAARADREESEKHVIISRSHTGSGADVVTEYLPDKTPTFAGGSGYKALKVLEGEADAYIHVTKIKAWDVCAADAVVRSYGGLFTDLKGQELRYDKKSPVFKGGLIAARDPPDHQIYVDKLAKVAAERGS